MACGELTWRKAASVASLLSTDASTEGDASPEAWQRSGACDRLWEPEQDHRSQAEVLEAAAGGGGGQRLRLRCGAFQVPHPKKVEYGGEDSFFVCEHGCAAGVADGVSEWGWRFGLNPRDFANELMEGARDAAERMQFDACSAQDRAKKALAAGFAGVKAFGAATAIVMTLDAAASEVGVANLGDSGLRHLRRSPASHGTTVVGHTAEQLHEFNQPFQLSRIPTPGDFSRLLTEGKLALVQAVRRCRTIKQDMPIDAQSYTFEVREGDLLILGSDGLFDNLHDWEICGIVDELRTTDPEDIAKAIAAAAARRSEDHEAGSPFSEYAAEAGFEYRGGVEDDITVVVAWVVA